MQTQQYRIKADFGYYSNTYYAPQDGYLQGDEQCDRRTGRYYTEPMTFDSVRAAGDYLTGGGYGCNPLDGLACDYDGEGQFSVGGTYVTAHGQHSRPNYTLVSRASGRCTKSIMAGCDAIAAMID